MSEHKPEHKPDPNKKVEAAVTAESIRSSKVVDEAKSQKKFHDLQQEAAEAEVHKKQQEKPKVVQASVPHAPATKPGPTDTAYHGGKDQDPSKV